MKTLILIVILLLILGGAIRYLYKAKKAGQTCVGCPYAKTCGSNKSNCSCK